MLTHLLRLAAALEAFTGLVLMIVPALVIRALLGESDGGISIPIARLAGIALLALGTACWSGPGTRNESRTALRALLVYNLLATVLLLWIGIDGIWAGPLLWPAIVIHGILTLALAQRWWTRHARH